MYEHSPKPFFRHIPTRGRSKWKLWLIRGIAIVCLLAIITASLSLWLRPAMSNYLGLDGEIVAQVQFSSTRIPHLILVNVILLAKDHQLSQSIDCYLMQGNTLTLQFDTITFASWENSLGLHLGYKLTRLLGCHSVAMLTDSDTRPGLNGGEDGFFTMVQRQNLYAELVQAKAYYSNSAPLLANLRVGQKTETFDVFTPPKASP